MMTMRRLLPLALASLAVPAWSAPTPLQQSADRVHAHVEFLASDLLEGRDTGSRGHEIAAAYVAGQFRALGLQPAGENGSWYQWVPFRRASAVPGKDSFSIIENGRSAPLTASDMSIRPSLTEKRRDLTAGLVFAGFGISEPLLGIDDYAGLDVRGKIVVYFRGVPDGQPADIAAHLDASKAETAASKGAVGVIEIPSGRGRQRPGSGTVAAPRPAIDWVDAKGGSGSTPPGLRVRLSVSTATAERLFAGAPARLADLRAPAGKGKRVKGFALKPSLSIRSETAWEDFKSPEVVALLPGADPALKGQYVAMMGHLDHLGIKKDAKPGEDAIYNGALDNAAGVATLLEAARQFVDSGRPPRRSILFTVHTAEEKGLLGADYYARHPTVPIQSIVAGVDLDMPVPLYPFTDVVAFGGDHSTLGRAVAQAGREMGIGVSPDPMPEQAIFTRSDHYQFVRAGVPAILLFTGYANGGKAKWDDFFSNRYHSVKDDLSQPIMWDAAARYAEFNFRIARTLADGAERPMWLQGNYFGDRFNPGGPRTNAAPKP
jgi:hypothetical protein